MLETASPSQPYIDRYLRLKLLTRATRLAMCKCRLAIPDIWTHSIHRLALLRTLVGHHRGSWASRAWIPICTRGGLGRPTRSHEVWRGSGIHHLWATDHSLGRKVRLHHHVSSQLRLSLRHILRIVGETSVVHLWCSGAHKHWLVVGNLTR